MKFGLDYIVLYDILYVCHSNGTFFSEVNAELKKVLEKG